MIRDETQEVWACTGESGSLHTGKDLGGQRSQTSDLTHHEVRNFATEMEEKETYLVKAQRVWVGQLEVGVAEKPSESRNTGERRIRRRSTRRSIRECAR